MSRLILDSLDRDAFDPIRGLTVGEFREWILDDATTGDELAAIRPGITPEMAAAVAKLMSNKDLVAGREQNPRRHPLPQHDGPARRAGHPRAAQPSRRRPRRASCSRPPTACSSAAATR